MPHRIFIALTLLATLAFPQATTLADELPPLLRSFQTVTTPAPPFQDGRFTPLPGETIAFIGGTNTFDQQKYPYLEILLTAAYPDRNLKFRNLVWHSDSLFHQHRPAFFFTEAKDKQPGSVPDQRERIDPGIIFLTFGKMESLDPDRDLTAFLSDYRDLLAGLQERTRRIVLVAPTPFFNSGPAAHLAETRNAKLARYTESLAALAAENNLLFVDTFTPLRDQTDAPLSPDSIHLNETGHRKVAEIVARRLQLPLDPSLVIAKDLDPITESIQKKNHLWQQYYHPTNWAFLFGDRQSQPASRDHTDKNKRWFIEEIQSLPALITETETTIYRHAAQLKK